MPVRKVRRAVSKKVEEEKSRKRTSPDLHEESSSDMHDASSTSRILNASGVPTVYVEKGVTKNMGDFNSARVTVGMSLPIDYTPEELAKAKKAIVVIDALVVAHLETEIEKLFD
jgi:hypothetical protein